MCVCVASGEKETRHEIHPWPGSGAPEMLEKKIKALRHPHRSKNFSIEDF